MCAWIYCVFFFCFNSNYAFKPLNSLAKAKKLNQNGENYIKCTYSTFDRHNKIGTGYLLFISGFYRLPFHLPLLFSPLSSSYHYCVSYIGVCVTYKILNTSWKKSAHIHILSFLLAHASFEIVTKEYFLQSIVQHWTEHWHWI